MGILKSKKKSLDLLTAEEESVKSSGNKFLIISIFSAIVTVELIIYGVFTLLSLSDRSKLREIKTQVEAESQSGSNLVTLATDIKNIKNKLTTYDQKIAGYIIDKKLEKIASLLPSTVNLLSLNINEAGKVLLKSETPEPESGYQFYEVLKADKEITTLTLDSVTKVGDKYNFDMTFTVLTK